MLKLPPETTPAEFWVYAVPGIFPLFNRFNTGLPAVSDQGSITDD